MTEKKCGAVGGGGLWISPELLLVTIDILPCIHFSLFLFVLICGSQTGVIGRQAIAEGFSGPQKVFCSSYSTGFSVHAPMNSNHSKAKKSFVFAGCFYPGQALEVVITCLRRTDAAELIRSVLTGAKISTPKCRIRRRFGTQMRQPCTLCFISLQHGDDKPSRERKTGAETGTPQMGQAQACLDRIASLDAVLTRQPNDKVDVWLKYSKISK